MNQEHLNVCQCYKNYLYKKCTALFSWKVSLTLHEKDDHNERKTKFD